MAENPYYGRPWRAPERVKERHEYIVALAGERTRVRSNNPLTLKEIALAVYEKFGSHNGKPLDHSTIIHALRRHRDRKCGCYHE